MRKIMVIGRIDPKRVETIKKNNDEGGFRKNIRTAKAYIVTRGALKTNDIASASFRVSTRPSLSLAYVGSVSSS
ncbi:MAG: hypothetical protein FJZ49_00510 [Candidatus Verstraetearchaeota archaeon]|nr:hypothetical protein [Candidatus Verstraetearchaeota archaeon]